MEIASTSSAIDLARSILWQYDKAPNFLNLVNGIDKLTSVSTDSFWSRYLTDVMDIDTATGPATDSSPFTGLDSLGRLIGVPRPATVNGDKASDELYRRLLKAHLFLSKSCASVGSINKYLVMLFGAKRTIDVSAIGHAVGDSVVVGGITYTFIPPGAKYGAVNEVKLGATDYDTAANLAAVINGDDGYSDDNGVLRQKPNPNVSSGGAEHSDESSKVDLTYEYWYAEGEIAFANVVVVDHADMTIDYRIADGFSPVGELGAFLTPWDSTSGILNGGQVLGYTMSGERIFGYADPSTGQTVKNPAFPILFPFPAGVRSHLATPPEGLSPLGLNETETLGQNLANFVFDDSQPNGAPFSATGYLE